MLLTIAQVPGATRRLPRSIPGTGPTSHRDTFRSEMQARLAALEREQRLQFERIAQMQHQLDEIKRMLLVLTKQKS